MAAKISWMAWFTSNGIESKHGFYSTDRSRCLVYLVLQPDGTWNVNRSICPGLDVPTRTLANCKSLGSAKRYAARHLNF